MDEASELKYLARLALRLAGELAEFSKPPAAIGIGTDSKSANLPPGDPLLVEFDRRILDDDLRAATRSRFVSGHYADAVEAGVKTLSECVRARSGRTDDGDTLMTNAGEFRRSKHLTR
jgi:hypothetical protein